MADTNVADTATTAVRKTRGPQVSQEQFIVTWEQNARNGGSATKVAETLNMSYGGVLSRYKKYVEELKISLTAMPRKAKGVGVQLMRDMGKEAIDKLLETASKQEPTT